ncbi:hypothetical protein LDDCCGHA_5064 [Methylobacterium oxalidis]|nr:hypothetical protein LDDCCGHA_5064 [Methylobacterium oxalidis]
MTRALWIIAQAAAILALTWLMMGNADPRPDPRLSGPLAWLVMAFFATCIVAFATALLTNLWDWCFRLLRRVHGELQGLPFRAGRAVARLRRARRDASQAVEQGDRGRARLGVRELSQPPPALR